MKNLSLLLLTCFLLSCEKPAPVVDPPALSLTLEEANRLSKLPLKCINKEYPNKTGQGLEAESDLGTPSKLHPAFYGCFDWHSSVHGHWMLVKLLKTFPDLESAAEIRTRLQQNLSAANVLAETEYLHRPGEKSYERTYGWAWVLKLVEELHTWDDPMAKALEANLKPLTDLLVARHMEFLPKLTYPIRMGEHSNSAFGLAFAWDYATAVGNDSLKTLLEKRSRDFYFNDAGCPLTWEPSGFDFLSPCFEEADLMRRVLPADTFKIWLDKFMPQLAKREFALEPAKVGDHKDGRQGHLDGLNFSRAWCLYGIATADERYRHLRKIAYDHYQYSQSQLMNGLYEGEHWLASFAIYALDAAEN